MKDTIIFMSAYDTTGYSKSKFTHFNKKQKLTTMLNKYHLRYILNDDKLISSSGILKLNTEYNYVQQKTLFSFETSKKEERIEDYEEIINNTNFCVKLLHAQTVLSDSAYFNIDYFICMDSFLVNINKRQLQVDPVIFSMNNILMIAFEVIDFETGKPLNSKEVFCKTGNYNLLTVENYQYFDKGSTVLWNGKISEIIYDNISSFFFELCGNTIKAENYSFIHNTLVLSNGINDVSEYICNLIGTRRLPSSLENISTTESYDYYPQDGVSVIKNYNPNEIDIPLYNGIMLESIKLYIYSFQMRSMETKGNLNKLIQYNIYLENLFYAPCIPIETHNLISYVHNTKLFQKQKEAISLKISYMSTENEINKNRNSVLLNILLYVISLLGAIGTLETLENQFKIPFKYSFIGIIIIFLVFGGFWGIIEWRRDRKF